MDTTTYWYCERCGHDGQVSHDAHEGVWQVYTQVVDAHHDSAEGACLDVNYVRVSSEPIAKQPGGG
jgi:hypothetical protein